uniref:Uncharacterized protein n=1 Tax=Anguilla anguilla TaxID=7936 RepID=A0A0E9U3R0_ANGAN
MGPSQRASEAGVQSRQDQVSSRPTSEPHQYSERESLLSCENQPSN